MANELSEPWRSFLDEINRSAPSDIALNCIGGFAVSLYYGLARPTGDIDVVGANSATGSRSARNSVSRGTAARDHRAS